MIQKPLTCFCSMFILSAKVIQAVQTVRQGHRVISGSIVTQAIKHPYWSHHTTRLHIAPTLTSNGVVMDGLCNVVSPLEGFMKDSRKGRCVQHAEQYTLENLCRHQNILNIETFLSMYLLETHCLAMSPDVSVSLFMTLSLLDAGTANSETF